MFAFKWFSLFPPPTSLKVLAPYHSLNNFILLGPIYTCSWLVNHLLKWHGRRWLSTCSIFKTPKALKLTINNALKVVTELNLFVLICYKHKLHFSDGDLSILMFQGQLSLIQTPNSYRLVGHNKQLLVVTTVIFGEKTQIWAVLLNLV